MTITAVADRDGVWVVTFTTVDDEPYRDDAQADDGGPCKDEE